MESHTPTPKIDGFLLTSEEAKKAHDRVIFLQADIELGFMKAHEQLDALKQAVYELHDLNQRAYKPREGIEG